MEGERKDRLYRHRGKRFKTRVCHRCGDFFLSHAKRGRICDNCRKKPGVDYNITLFSRIQAIEEQKKVNMDRYAIVDSKKQIIEKFRSKYLAKIQLTKLEHEFYKKLIIIELKNEK